MDKDILLDKEMMYQPPHEVAHHYNNNSNFDEKEEDPDSGLVEDAYDVLPDEETLAFDIDLELDLSDGNFGRCSTTTGDFSDLLDMDTSLADLDDNVFPTDSVPPESYILPAISNMSKSQRDIDITDAVVNDDIDNSDYNSTVKENGSTVIYDDKKPVECNEKLKSFSKEQARQWRRKRILKSCEEKAKPKVEVKGNKTHKVPTKLEPLLPLPKSLKPLTSKAILHKKGSHTDKINPADKLANPLLGGEKLGTKTKRGPVPMKLRALPESFWKEPSTIHTSSLAGHNYAVLPPLFASEGKHSDDVRNIRPVTPPDDKKNSPRHSPRSKKKWVMTSPPDTELLNSLFNHLENKVDEKLIVRRGRPKKSTTDKIPPPPVSNRDDDPCIVDDLATKLFPDLTLYQKPGKEKPIAPNYAMIRIGKGNHRLEFPAIRVKDNYPAILSELVKNM